MGFWNWLNGTKPAPDTAESFLDRTISIPERNFFGMCARSPNRRFCLAWMDGGPDQSRVGRYLLLDGTKVVIDRKMPRPNEGKVVDSGVFLIQDWGDAAALSGTLYVFAPDGRTLLARAFAANLYAGDLSGDGRFAVCQTANAPGPDGNLLTLFDVEARETIAAFQPESGWAKSYQFFPEERRLRLVYHDGGAFDYGYDGTFLDRMKWLAFGLQKGDVFIIEKLIAEADGKPGADLAAQLLPATQTALQKTRADDPRTRARVLKSRGICLEAVAELKHALACYDEALSLDPKVGVKRKADGLRKVV